MSAMDDLIKEYAETLKNAKVGDFTYSGILAEFARKVISTVNTGDVTLQLSHEEAHALRMVLGMIVRQ